MRDLSSFKPFFIAFFMTLFLKTEVSFSFFDSLLRVAEKTADTALILDSVDDLLSEVKKDNLLSQEMSSLTEDLKELKKEAYELERLKRETGYIFSYPENRLKSLNRKLRFSLDKIKRVKNLKTKILKKTTASASAVTATEQMRTNQNLSHIIRQSHLKEIEEERQKIAQIREKIKKEKEEREFLRKELEKINKHSKYSGFGSFHPFKHKERD